MAEVDRCKCEGITQGFAKITVQKNSGGKILGATVVGPNAGSMISELSICIQVSLLLLAFVREGHRYLTGVWMEV